MNSKVRFATTVGELQEALKDLPPDTRIVQARDHEGNGYLPVMEVETGLYSPEADLVLSAAYAALLPPDSHPVVCLRPAHDWQHAQTTTASRKLPEKRKQTKRLDL
jgi:hypothetical protein